MNTIVPSESIKDNIFTFRGVQIIIDRDLARLYCVKTKALNQAVKRNIERFPNDFMFQLTELEKDELVTNCDRFATIKHSSSLPYAFTEQGVANLASVLNSNNAIKVNIQIMRAFVSMRRFIHQNASLFHRMGYVEEKLLDYDSKLKQVFNALESHIPKKGIFYDGQVFDAYIFISDLIRSSKESIILIDNFIDDTVLTLFSKRKKGISVTIYTKNISKQLELDIKKYNSQYEPIEIKEFNHSHDRFMIIDDKEVYHIGASLKDLGKKWFAFSKFKKNVLQMLEKLK